MALIVLDLSFLRGASRGQLEALFERYDVLVPSTLIMELLTATQSKRLVAAERLLGRRFRLVAQVGEFLKHEIAACTPAEWSSPAVVRDAHLGDGLARPKLVLSGRCACAIYDWRQELDAEVDNFVQIAALVPNVFPELKGVRECDRKVVTAELQRKLPANRNRLQALHDQIRRGRGPAGSVLGDDWVLLRRMEMHAWSALELFGAYGATALQSPFSVKTRKQLGNEMLDLQYRIVGLLAAGIASHEVRYRRAHLDLCPDGILLDKAWVP